jgi:hypothetical protein
VSHHRLAAANTAPAAATAKLGAAGPAKSALLLLTPLHLFVLLALLCPALPQPCCCASACSRWVPC